MTNFASRAARELNERIAVVTQSHTWHDIAADPQDSTAFLEDPSADLMRERFPRRPSGLIKHPTRLGVWVRHLPTGETEPRVSPLLPASPVGTTCHGRPEGKDVA